EGSRSYLEQHREQMEAFARDFDNQVAGRGLRRIPIQAHIICRDNGTGCLPLSDLEEALEDANAAYNYLNLQFFLCGEPIYIHDSDLYSHDPDTDRDDLQAASFVNNAINVYFVGGISLCGYASFPWTRASNGWDHIVMSNSCTTNGSTFPHEIGHYFSLLHTHQTWLDEDGETIFEFVDGSNCSQAGDLICDTRADPGLSGLVDADCNYTGDLQDPNGDFYNPDPNNMMSYSRKACRDAFTYEQRIRMAWSLDNDRDYLRCGGGYCETGAGGNHHQWIKRVNVGMINHHSGIDNGYADNTNMATELSRGYGHPIALRAGTEFSNYSARWRVWIDFNQDDDFNDSGELVFYKAQSVEWAASSTEFVSGTFDVPAGARLGATRMRVSMGVNTWPSACGGSYLGETEDYVVYIRDGYCSAVASSGYEYIKGVFGANIAHWSYNNGGYSNFSGHVGSAEKGEELSFWLIPGFTNSTYNESWTIWVDYNQDNDFNDAGERVFVSSEPRDNLVWAKFTVPASALPGATRMRISMKYGNTPGTNPCPSFQYGEIEDYTLIISPGYCAAAGNDQDYEWIQRVHFADYIDNTSGNNDGYGDFSHQVANVQKGHYYSLVLTPGFAGSSYDESWKVWIDYDRDGQFEDATELVYERISKNSVGNYILIDPTAEEGYTRMRVSMTYYSHEGSQGACSQITYGEIEDYTLHILPTATGADAAAANPGELPGLDLPAPFISDEKPPVPREENKGTTAEAWPELEVFPNPTAGTVNIRLPLQTAEASRIQVMSFTGKVVLARDIPASPALAEQISLTGLPTGTYIVQVVANGQL
ncbi:MAG: zinc-dependent metalloprotease, partial [Phaeodactylibacter sp.]|nr:zinc-dependent metalloprotease [Phaeodactylibacter sp.]